MLFNSVTKVSVNNSKLSKDSSAFLRKGYAMAQTLAPRTRHLAISRPFLIPPDAMMGIFTALLTSIKHNAVGIPQSQNNSPILVLTAFWTISASQFFYTSPTCTPVSSDIHGSTPTFSRLFATSFEIPAPTSFTITGMSRTLTISFILVRTPLYFGSPSGCTSS